MSLEEANAFSALNQLIIPNFQNNVLPTPKLPNGDIKMDDQVMQLLQNLPLFNNVQQMLIQTNQLQNENNLEVEAEKPSPSNDSDSSRNANSPMDINNDDSVMNGTIGNQENMSNNGKSQSSRSDGWFECFTTTSKSEYEALIYSLYVIDKDDRKMDGWQYFECLNRLQNKCRFKIRVKKQDEFYIVEEKCGHNHGIEPVGQAGSHAGLPKTLREIVDKSFNENWLQEIRTSKIDEEIRRLGLPPNPRLGRQIDNRVAYLRRVKNLQESKRIQDQISGGSTSSGNSLFDAQMLQLLGASGDNNFPLMETLMSQQAEQANEQDDAENEQHVDVENQVETKIMTDPSKVLQQLIEQQKAHQNEQAVQFIQQAIPNLEMMTPNNTQFNTPSE
ncbi:unnamed protein product [Caenorhabditis angaria]|uniref:FLYWCH-type domain-containing protein n=1 Tax=Caenorhabditis angaria TaxID=860376 RepID=A0A9P1IBY2_9PELO|nr:unnamed protein product [Caenorhabditis angaria]